MTVLLISTLFALVIGPAVFFFLGDRIVRHVRETWRAAGGRMKD